MKKQNLILSAALVAVFSASTAFAEAEVTGKIVHESGFFSEAGSTIGDYGVSTANGSGALGTYTGVTTTATPSHAKRDAFKKETTAKIYIDGEVNEIADGATYHVELNLMTDGKGTLNYDSNEAYTQRDALREAYVDSQVGDWSLRTGKQQVVWGTADGMKLLDAINPTDYSEMAQNQMEDSRIPVWMINAEKDLEAGGNVQVVVSEPKENVFAGLNRNIDTGVRANNATLDDTTLNNGTDTGHAFMMMGPDTITGAYNGFLNIAPDLGSVATRFAMAFTPDGTTGVGAAYAGNTVTMSNLNTAQMAGFTVDAFEAMRMDTMNGALVGAGATTATGNADNYTGAGNNFANIAEGMERAIWNVAKAVNSTATPSVAELNAVTGAQLLEFGFQPLYNSNLANQTTAQDTAFDYMGSTTFRTFDTFTNVSSQYVYNMPDSSDVDVATRFSGATENGVNYSVNASYNYDKNPIINLSWRGSAGQELATHQFTESGNTSLQLYDPLVISTGSNTDITNGNALGTTSATDFAGVYGGAAQQSGLSSNKATLQFSQEVKRVKQIGGSFDTAIETSTLGPVVIRGEALYTKDGYSPVMNKDKLAIGDLVGALEMVKGDRAKIVLGADITAMTNMMISAQFIQDSNLDFVDNGNNYTADYATMHLSNGFNKAIKDKNFYSLFFSKPFGASGEHRWNNITMLEEGVGGNGKWNRLDAEFSIDDDTQATVEYNKYWGNANTQFGQLEKSSNIQVGIKYSF
jgi:hypothetical protein